MPTNIDEGLFFTKPCEVAAARVVITPGCSRPYKVVFRIGDRVLSEHPVPSVREGELLIRSELAAIQFSARRKQPQPDAPDRAEIGRPE